MKLEVITNTSDDLVNSIITESQTKNIEYSELLGLIKDHTLNKQHIARICEGWNSTPAQVRKSIVTAKRNSELGGKVDTVWDFVELQLRQWRCELIGLGQFRIDTPYDMGDGHFATEDDLKNLNNEDQWRVRLRDPKTYNLITLVSELQVAADKLHLSYTKTQITDAASRWERREWNDKISNLLSRLCYPSELDPVAFHNLTEPRWDDLVKEITDDDPEIIKAVLKHFIWQTKRKIKSMPISYHMMVVLYGAQGAGKSTFIQQFTMPLGDFVASTDFAQITDTRNHALWNNYILVVDEMGYSTTANLEEIKRKITEFSFDSRVLGSHNSTKVINKSTMIGSTNKDISRLVFDDTGMRRFFQISMKNPLNWAAINNIDYLTLWRSVDENAASPITDNEMFAAIQQRQEEYRHQSDIERWLRERFSNKRLNIRMGIEQEYTGQAFYQEFQQWEKDNGVQKLTTNTKFGRDLKDIPLVMKIIEIEKVRNEFGAIYKVTYISAP